MMLRRLANLTLSVLLIGLLSVAAAAALIPAVTGTRVITIQTNSMQDVLPTGSIAYIGPAPAAAYQIGDWVTFHRNGQTVTHAVTGYGENPANGQIDPTRLQTKGTANLSEDPYLVTTDQVLGRVTYHAPVLGTALTLVGKPVIQMFLALLALTCWLASRQPRTTTPTLSTPQETTT